DRRAGFERPVGIGARAAVLGDRPAPGLSLRSAARLARVARERELVQRFGAERAARGEAAVGLERQLQAVVVVVLEAVSRAAEVVGEVRLVDVVRDAARERERAATAAEPLGE